MYISFQILSHVSLLFSAETLGIPRLIALGGNFRENWEQLMVNGSFSFLYLWKLHKETTYFHNNQLSANLSDLMYFYLKLPTVLPIADAKKAEIKRYLIPATAKINSLYRKHPLDPSRYIAVSTFHDTIINEKKDEFCTLLKTIGAKYITFRNHPEWNKSYLSPDNTIVHNPHHGEQLEKNFKFFASSSAWQKADSSELETSKLERQAIHDQSPNLAKRSCWTATP